MIRVAVIDDDPVFGNGAAERFNSFEGFQGVYFTPEEIESMIGEFQVVMVDHRLGRGVFGPDVIKGLKPGMPNTVFFGWTNDEITSRLKQMFTNSGAVDLLDKMISGQDLEKLLLRYF